MKPLTILFCIVLAAQSFAAFPTNTTTKTVDTSIPATDFRDFLFTWNYWEDQNVHFTATYAGAPFNFSGYYCRFRMAQDLESGQKDALDVLPAQIHIASSNVVFYVCKTNVPNKGVYQAQLDLLDSMTTNIVKVLCRGRVVVQESLYP